MGGAHPGDKGSPRGVERRGGPRREEAGARPAPARAPQSGGAYLPPARARRSRAALHGPSAPVVREAKKAEKPKEKTLLEIKIEEREAREAAEAAQKAALRAEAGIADTVGSDAAVDDKQRRRELEEAADFDNALDAFGGMEPPSKPVIGKREPKLPSADGFVAKTDADFETLAKMMYAQLQPHEVRTAPRRPRASPR